MMPLSVSERMNTENMSRLENETMKRKLICLSLLSLLFVGCGRESDTENKTENKTEEKTFEVTDMIGRKNSISLEDAKRVVCIGAGALRLYSYIGDQENLVAVEDIERSVGSNVFESVSRPYYDINKEFYKTLPSCGKGGPQAQQAEAEKILSVAPSLIISEYGDVSKADALQEQVGVPVVVVSYGKKSVFDDNVKHSFTLLGKVLGKEERARNLNNYIASAEQELASKAKSVKGEDKKSIYIGCLGNWGTQDIYSTSSSFPLFEVSSIKNAVTSDVTVNNGKLEEEAFLSLNPDRIVLDSAGLARFKTTYETDPSKFDELKAFQEGEIYLEMPFNAYYTNLEIALMDSYFLASVAYPEVYQDFDLQGKYNEIGEAFLSKDCYTYVKAAPMSYGGFQKISNIKEFLKNV